MKKKEDKHLLGRLRSICSSGGGRHEVPTLMEIRSALFNEDVSVPLGGDEIDALIAEVRREKSSKGGLK